MDLAISLLRRQPSPRAEKPHAPLSCRSCGSALVQIEAWRELPGDRLMLSFRCPECLDFSSGSFEYERAAGYDQALVRSRQVLLASYEALVRHNMEELASRMSRALELDLIGADDFSPRASAARAPDRWRPAAGYNRPVEPMNDDDV